MVGVPTPRVLIVEDEMTVAMRIAEILEDMGCEPVGPAALVVTALPTAISEPLDAAVLDVFLIDQAVDAVADVLQRRGVPFAFVTVHSRDRLPAAHRARPYVEKPFTDRQLRTVVATMLNPP